MPSTESTKAPGLLDLENDQRDWFSEFREERALHEESRESHRHDGETLFTVVAHGRPAPIVLSDAPMTVQTTQTPALRLLSLFERVKRAFSPSLTALLIFYVAAIWLTATIGINRRQSETARGAETAVTSPATLARPAA